MPTKIVVDCSTGIAEEIELTAEEVAELEASAAKAEADRIATEAEKAAKEAARADILKKLGLTEEEAAVLLG